nr:MAG TPA_asm: hypothetical protein [Inoviridae sp.]
MWQCEDTRILQWNFFVKRKKIYTTNSIFPIDFQSTASFVEDLKITGFFHSFPLWKNTGFVV